MIVTGFGLGVSFGNVKLGLGNILGPTIDNAGTLSGSTIGTEITVSGVQTSGTVTETTYQWFVGGVPKDGATAATYTPVQADDGKIIARRITVSNDEGSNSASSNILTVIQVAPVASGSLADQVYSEASGLQSVDASGEFTGEGLTYSITAGGAYASVDSETGIVTIDTAVAAATTVITVTATNSGGSASLSFDIEIQTAPPVAIGSVADLSLLRGSDDYTLDVSGEFTGTNRVYSIVAGGGFASVDSATGVVTIDTSSGVSETTVTVRATNVGGSDDLSFLVEVTLPAPVASGSIADRSYTQDIAASPIPTAQAFTGEVDTYSLSPSVAWASIDASGEITVDTSAVQATTSFTVTASNFGGSATQSFDIAVVVAAPVLSGAIPDQTLTVGSGIVTVDGTQAFTGESLTYSISPVGIATINSGTGAISIDTAALASGSFTVRATNASGFVEGSFAVAVNDAAPVINSYPSVFEYSQDSGEQTIDLASYVDGENLIFSIVSGGSIATVTTAGLLQFDTDTLLDESPVVVSVSNSGGSGQLTVNITVEALAPVITSAVPDLDLTKGVPATYDLTQHVSGADLEFTRIGAASFVTVSLGGLLTIDTTNTQAAEEQTIRASNGSGSVDLIFNVTVAVAAPVATGTIPDAEYDEQTGVQTVDASGYFTGEDLTYSITSGGAYASVDAGTGIVSIDTSVAVGTTGVTVTATNAGGSASLSFDIEIQTAPPVASGSVSDQSLLRGSGVQTLDVSGEFTGTNLVYSVVSGGGFASVDSGTGVVSIDTTSGVSETTVTVRATNAAGSDDLSFLVEVTLPAPVASGVLSDQTYDQGEAVSPIATAQAFTGEVDAYSLAPSVAWASIDASGEITVDTSAVQSTTSFTVTASNFGGSATQSFDITILVVAPVVSGDIPDQTLTIGSGTITVDGTQAFTGQDLTYSITPAGVATINSSTGLISIDTAAIDTETFTVRATNASGFVEDSFSVAINEVAPSLTGNPGAQAFTLNAGDQDIDLTAYVVGENITWTKAIGGDRVSIAPNGTATIKTDQALSDYTVAFDATNSGGTARVSFAVTVAVAAPVKLSDPSALVFYKGQAATYDLSQHVSGDDLTYTKTGGIGLLSVDSSTGLLTPNVTDAYAQASRTVVVSNASGSVSLPILIEVKLVAPAVASPISDQEFDVSTGDQRISLLGVFSGESLTYSITAGGSVVSLDGTDLVIPTDTLQSDITVTVRAENATGSVEDTFLLSVVTTEMQPPSGWEIGAAAGSETGEVFIAWVPPTLWGDAVTPGDAAGTAGNLKVTIDGTEYYMLDGPTISGGVIGADHTVTLAPEDRDIPIDDVRGPAIGEGVIGQTFLVGGIPGLADMSDTALVNRLDLTALESQTVTITAFWFNGEGEQDAIQSFSVTVPAAPVDETPANALTSRTTPGEVLTSRIEADEILTSRVEAA